MYRETRVQSIIDLNQHAVIAANFQHPGRIHVCDDINQLSCAPLCLYNHSL